MHQNFICHDGIDINPNIKTAIIYAIDHIFSYIVEIKEGNTSYYIENKGEVLQFGNMEDARQAAIKEKVQEAYLALSKTSEETDLTTCHANHQDHYDYSPIQLKS